MKIYKYTDCTVKIINNKNENYKAEIQTKRLFIKSYSGCDNDKELYFKLFKDLESTKLYGEGGPLSDDKILARLKMWSNRLANKEPFVGLMIYEKDQDNNIIMNEAVENERFIGHCILAPSRNIPGEVEYAILLFKSSWNRGYGSEISNCIVNEYSNALKMEGYKSNGGYINSVFATARIDNNGSNSVINKIGMKQIDKKELYGFERYIYVKSLI